MMVDHLATITNRDERTRAAKTVISVMGNLYPHLRDVPDFRHKLWDHLMIMSNFTLDIDSPYPLPEKDILEEKPERLPYNNHHIKYKHYGLLTEKLIEKIKETEDPEIKRVLTVLTANHMKRSFLTWNKDSVEDDQIYNDINTLYGGNIEMPEGMILSHSKDCCAGGSCWNWNGGIYGCGGLEICSFRISPCRSAITSDKCCRNPGGKHQCLTLTSRK